MKFDVAIIGSGFAGSILAWVLSKRGRRVALIDAATHPRFAIGESSTPIADLMLRRLGEKYDLPELVRLSTYGGWQTHYPQIACGIKRGFSYYRHEVDTEYVDQPDHSNSLLVAASRTEALADTHWYRRDTDDFFFRNAIDAGAVDFSGQAVTSLQLGDVNRLGLSDSKSINAGFVIDASGQSAVTARMFGAKDLSFSLTTNTRSVFAHFRGVERWGPTVAAYDDPFDGDHAAQHHLIDDGWLWMLRFGNGVTSVGLTVEGHRNPMIFPQRYPSIMKLFSNSELIAPENPPRTTGRLQRLFDPVISRRCWMLPTAAVTIDPLHSTGIAHALAGVERTLDLIDGGAKQDDLDRYGQVVLSEARMLDRMVWMAYQSINDFPRFTVACMLYFAAAIRCEERFSAGDTPSQLWSADDRAFVSMVDELSQRFSLLSSTRKLVEEVRSRIQPWNTAGLMDDSVHNRYAYTATKK